MFLYFFRGIYSILKPKNKDKETFSVIYQSWCSVNTDSYVRFVQTRIIEPLHREIEIIWEFNGSEQRQGFGEIGESGEQEEKITYC